MACERGHTHFIVFTHACGYYSRAATIRGAASIRISTVSMQRQRTFTGGEVIISSIGYCKEEKNF